MDLFFTKPGTGMIKDVSYKIYQYNNYYRPFYGHNMDEVLRIISYQYELVHVFNNEDEWDKYIIKKI